MVTAYAYHKVAFKRFCDTLPLIVVPREHSIHIHSYSDSLEYTQELCNQWPNLRIGLTGVDYLGLLLERPLLVTDGPYMRPDPFRGQTAHPGHVHRVAEKIAEWQGRPHGEVMVATRRSTKRSL